MPVTPVFGAGGPAVSGGPGRHRTVADISTAALTGFGFAISIDAAKGANPEILAAVSGGEGLATEA